MLPLFKLVAANGGLGWCNETQAKGSLATELLDLMRQPIRQLGRLSHLGQAGCFRGMRVPVRVKVATGGMTAAYQVNDRGRVGKPYNERCDALGLHIE